MDISNPLTYGGPIFLLFIIIEYFYSKKKGDHGVYEKKDMFASITMGAVGAMIGAIMKLALGAIIFETVFDFFASYRVEYLGYDSFGFAWYVWLICQLCDDFSYYWFHRLNHTCRFLWAAHIVHHSSEKYNYGTGIRNGWFTLLYKPFFYVWMAALGFEPSMMLVCLGIEALWQFQLHSTYVPKMGIFEKFLNTHTLHQAHHAQNIEYLDKNHGGYLNIFDRIFGSYIELEDTEFEVKYGVVHAPESYNPLVILTHEYGDIWRDVKKTANPYNWFMYTFGPPGWCHDGSTYTVKQVQKLYAEEKAAAKAEGRPIQFDTSKL